MRRLDFPARWVRRPASNPCLSQGARCHFVTVGPSGRQVVKCPSRLPPCLCLFTVCRTCMVKLTEPMRSCGCLPMCNFTDVAITLHALPTRAWGVSPWRSYLKTVYGHTIPPSETVNIFALELFYLSRLPVQWCNTPRCLRCDGWLDRKAVLRLTKGTSAIQEQRKAILALRSR